MPLVSVIIPSYNRAHLVPTTIDSVLKQSFHDFEIIVVDDGSTDNTGEIVSAFPVKYIQQENQGLPSARNTGIKAAQGKYIAILDSDDCLFEYSLEKRVKIMELHPEVAYVYSGICAMDENNNIIGTPKLPFKNSCIRDGQEELHDLLYANHVPASTVMMRRSCLDKVGMFNPTFVNGVEDLEMWVRLSAVYNSAYIAEPLVKLRIHTHRMTDQLHLKFIEDNHRRILESVFNDPVLGPLFSSERNNIYFHLYSFIADGAYTRRKMEISRSYLFKAIKTYPMGILGRKGLYWISMIIKTSTPKAILETGRKGKRMIQSINLSHSTNIL